MQLSRLPIQDLQHGLKIQEKGKLNSPLMFARVNCRPELNTL